MRPIGHPDFQYTPWSPERRAVASKAARERVKAASTKSVAKAQRKKLAPVEAEGIVNNTSRHGSTPFGDVAAPEGLGGLPAHSQGLQSSVTGCR
jgi:hypothetical protein